MIKQKIRSTMQICKRCHIVNAEQCMNCQKLKEHVFNHMIDLDISYNDTMLEIKARHSNIKSMEFKFDFTDEDTENDKS